MKETGIIMSGDHPLKILDGSKTQTRRTYGLEKVNQEPDAWEFKRLNNGGIALFWRKNIMEEDIALCKCPYGQVGDLLWGRETWATEKIYDDWKPADIPTWAFISYQASKEWGGYIMPIIGKTRPSIFMPRWASRLERIIALLRAERLLDISEADARAEGFNSIEEFLAYWDILNKKRGYGVDKNPWNWVIVW